VLAHVQHRHEQTLNSADGILWFGCLAFAATGSGMAIILGNVQRRSEKVFVVSMARPSGSSPTPASHSSLHGQLLLYILLLSRINGQVLIN